MISVITVSYTHLDVYKRQEQGDALLQYLAHQLQSELACENSCFSRIGSDVFAVFLPSKNGGEKAADKIVNICRNYPLNMEIIPAIGIYEITDRSIRASLMLSLIHIFNKLSISSVLLAPISCSKAVEIRLRRISGSQSGYNS